MLGVSSSWPNYFGTSRGPGNGGGASEGSRRSRRRPDLEAGSVRAHSATLAQAAFRVLDQLHGSDTDRIEGRDHCLGGIDPSQLRDANLRRCAPRAGDGGGGIAERECSGASELRLRDEVVILLRCVRRNGNTTGTTHLRPPQ